MAKLIRVDGTIEEFDAASASLEDLQAMVGGYIQEAPMPRGQDIATIICNEEGKLMGLPMNREATRIFQDAWRSNADYIAGNAIIVTLDEYRRMR